MPQDFVGNSNESTTVLSQEPFLLRPEGKEGKCYIYTDPKNASAGKQPCTNGWEYDTPYGENYPVNEVSMGARREGGAAPLDFEK